MKKNESNERFDEVKAKMNECSKTFEAGFETAQAVGAEAGERISKFIDKAKEKYGPKFEEAKKKATEKFGDIKEDAKKGYSKFLEDVEKRRETMRQEKALRKVEDSLAEADFYFKVSKEASQKGQEAYYAAVEAQKEYDKMYGTSTKGRKGTKKKTEE